MPTPISKNGRLFYRAAKARFDDAQLLFNLKRTTAAMYLAGYSVECMLKSLILSVVPLTQEDQILGMFRGARAHNYNWLIGQYWLRGGAPFPPSIVPHFNIVVRWSTDLRYSPRIIRTHEAKAFLTSVTDMIKWADGRL